MARTTGSLHAIARLLYLACECAQVRTCSSGSAPLAPRVELLNATEREPLLFVDTAVLQSVSQLQLKVHPPEPGDRILYPTEPWESWAVFACNSVVQTRPGDANYSADTAVRMYYDCVEEGTEEHFGQLGWRKTCVAVSPDGLSWTKPSLTIVPYFGQPSNILTNCTAPAVFIDRNPHAPVEQRWKMFCDNTVWAGPDGWHFQPMFGRGHKSISHYDDTMDVGYWDHALQRYVVYVRRNVQVPGKAPPRPGPGGDSVRRQIGRCETDDLSDWEKFAPSSGCECVFGPDMHDPDDVDVYTSSWTRYAGIEWFFPTFYHHFDTANPDGFSNDGLLNIRLVASRSTHNLSYISADNGRQPFVAWGLNTCGEDAVHPSLKGGWCNDSDGALATTTFDTSGGYMVAGAVESLDGTSVLVYASGQPFTHGGDAAAVTWANNTGIRVLRSRKHGFVSISAPYQFNQPRSSMPHFVTKPITVPDGEVSLLLNIKTSNVGFAVVELRTRSGSALPGFELNASDPIRANSVGARASWNRGARTFSVPDGEVVVVVAFADAELYSLWFDVQ